MDLRTQDAWRRITTEWTTILAPMDVQLTLQDRAALVHRKVTRPNGVVVNQYKFKSA